MEKANNRTNEKTINSEERSMYESRFICNKIIKKYLRFRKVERLPLTGERLNCLTQLVDIAHRKLFNGKPLICEAYSVSGEILFLPTAVYRYNFALGKTEFRKQFENREKIYQENLENQLSEKCRVKIDKLITDVLEITQNIETIDLIDALKFDSIKALRENATDYSYISIAQETVQEIFKQFDIKRLKELNEKGRTQS